MESTKTLLLSRKDLNGTLQSHLSRFTSQRFFYTLYAVAFAAAVSTWFVAARAPLWLDETVSFFLIKGGFTELFSRQGWPTIPAYSFLIWLWTKIAGTGEFTLRIPSILAMIAASYLIYRAARELFDRDVAMIAAIIFFSPRRDF